MKAIKVPLKEAEKVKSLLIKQGLLCRVCPPIKDSKYIYFAINGRVPGFTQVEKRFNKIVSSDSLFLKGLTKKEYSLLPTSYDLIGDIMILDLPEELSKKSKFIAETYIKILKGIKVVADKVGIHHGVFRTQDLKILSGEKRKITTHIENGLRMKLNVETCYFSPRLSTDRIDVASQIKKPEQVLVMFSGVAPYPLVISKYSKAKEIIGIEINPEAHKFAEENIKLNKLKNIKVYQGDVRKVLPKLKMNFDRILMPLPRSAELFLDLALEYIKPNGIIHLYGFSDDLQLAESYVRAIKHLDKHAKILKIRKCGQFAPRKFRIRVDFSP